jgi:O-methyltransferase
MGKHGGGLFLQSQGHYRTRRAAAQDRNHAGSISILPKPDVERYPVDKGDALYRAGMLAVSQAEVEDNFRKYGLLDQQVVFLKGWFKDTLPGAPIHKLAVLRLDGDLYGSTMDALTNLYPKLSPGGFCIVDDYDWPGCRQAVDDFAAQQGMTLSLSKAGNVAGQYWRKTQLGQALTVQLYGALHSLS